MTGMHPQRGFTLIELVVVMVVMGILLTMAIPSFTGLMDSIRVKRAGDAVSAFLVNAKSEAIKRNTTVRAVVKSAGSGATWCVGMTTASTCDCLTAGSCQIDSVDRIVSSTAYKKIVLNGPDNGHAFIFSALRGTVSGNETVELESSNALKLDVVVGMTGRVRLCSPDGSTGGYPEC
jgi:type IV fimbrial biogenesis protein FimT